MQNKKEIVDVIYESLNDPSKNQLHEKQLKEIIGNSIDKGWKGYRDIDGPGFSQSLIWAMDRLGVK